MNKLSADFKREHFVLVDDDADDRDLFAEALAFIAPTIKLTLKRDAGELLEFLKEEKSRLPDLIFLDLNMPRIDGKQCLVLLQTDPVLKTIPVIIYSTSQNPWDVQEVYACGAFHFLRKPNSIRDLREILNYIVFSPAMTVGKTPMEDFVITAPGILNT